MGLQIGDVGRSIDVTIVDDEGNGLDLSDAVLVEFLMRTHVGYYKTVDAVAIDAANGAFQYVPDDVGFLSDVGTWLIQCHVVQPTSDWHTGQTTFQVGAVMARGA